MSTLDDREAAIRGMIDSLRLEEIEELTDEGSSDVNLAIHQFESRSITLWGKALDKFVRQYLALCPVDNMPLDEEELKERFKVAFDEKTQPLTRYLLKVALRGGKPLSLAQLAARRHKPHTNCFRKLQRNLLHSTAFPMRDLRLWTVHTHWRVLRNGKTDVSHYEFSAGPGLLAFHKYVYLPWRIRQIEKFYTQHLKEDAYGND
jgi:hypothetical protein